MLTSKSLASVNIWHSKRKVLECSSLRFKSLDQLYPPQELRENQNPWEVCVWSMAAMMDKNRPCKQRKEQDSDRKHSQIKHQSSLSASVRSSRDGLCPPCTHQLLKGPRGSTNHADLLLNFLSISSFLWCAESQFRADGLRTLKQEGLASYGGQRRSLGLLHIMTRPVSNWESSPFCPTTAWILWSPENSAASAPTPWVLHCNRTQKKTPPFQYSSHILWV